ncbi:MAG: phosphoribosyltransferase family protein [Planctomycetaceae bacterium]
MKSTFWQLADLLFPSRCALCGSVDHAASDSRNAYCPDCIEKLTPEPLNRCHRCAAEIGPYASSNDGCVHCRNRKLRFNSVVCLGMYDGSLQKALLAAKWSFSAVRMRSLGALLATGRLAELNDISFDRIVPIPQHWRQRLVRHFNPAWIIAHELATQLNIHCDVHLLRRTSRTRPQKRVSVNQRFENQSGTLSVADPPAVKGERILIVDDVLTTGATCSEAAKVLKAAGAKSCSVAVLARVLDHSA